MANDDNHDVGKSGEVCKTCEFALDKTDAAFNCLSCACVMHLTEECAGLSKNLVKAIKDLGSNILLLCNECVDAGKRDLIVRRETVSRIEERNEAKLNHMTSQLNEIKTELNNLKHEHVKTFADGESTINVALPPEPTPKMTKPVNIEDGIRIRGLPESDSKDARQRHEHDMNEVHKILQHMNTDCLIDDIRRVGKFEAGKIRPIITKVSNSFQRRIILLSLAKLKTYEKRVFINREYTKEEASLENKLLKARRDMIDKEKINPKDIRLRNFELQRKVKVNNTETWAVIKLPESE